MEDRQIGITGDNGELKGYRIDSEVITGLYITVTPEKIRSNCEDFNIVVGESSKISKRDNVSIFTINIDETNQLQYLVGDDLNVEELEELTPRQMSQELKEGILQSFELAQIRNLSDLKQKD